MSEAQTEGCQMILVDRAGRVLLQLRDDIPSIAFPGMWALPGGMLEPGETPIACIVREMREEMGLDLSAGAVSHLATRQRSYGTEHTFTALADVEADRIELTEGQAVRWFSLEQVEGMRLAYEDETVLAEFAHAAGAGSTGGR